MRDNEWLPLHHLFCCNLVSWGFSLFHLLTKLPLFQFMRFYVLCILSAMPLESAGGVNGSVDAWLVAQDQPIMDIFFL